MPPVVAGSVIVTAPPSYPAGGSGDTVTAPSPLAWPDGRVDKLSVPTPPGPLVKAVELERISGFGIYAMRSKPLTLSAVGMVRVRVPDVTVCVPPKS